MALKEYGITGIPGALNNPRIIKYFQDIGSNYVKDDETAWCAAFASFIMKECGLPYTGKLNARSWLNIGTPVDRGELGDIVVLWRISRQSAYGHVGFYVNEDKDFIYILGGNEDNSVKIKAFSKTYLLGYRRFTK